MLDVKRLVNLFRSDILANMCVSKKDDLYQKN